MMLLAFCCILVVTASAFPQGTPDELIELKPEPRLYKEPIAIVDMKMDVSHDGNFKYSYESADGTKAEQVGELRDFGKDKKGSVASGAYEYIGDDGLTYKVTYIADENGFQAQGAHLPVAPPVPEEIARALAYIAAHPPKPEKHQDFPTEVIAN